jgi:hypothetical protein
MIRNVIFMIFFAITSACLPKKESTSSQKVSNNKNSHSNVVVGLVAERELLGFLDSDLDNFGNTFKSNSARDEFGILPLNISLKKSATISTMKQTIISAVSRMSGDGTLILFIGGHGSDQATIYTQDGQFLNFDQLDGWLKEARARKGPIARAVILITACHSGSWTDRLAKQNNTRVVTQGTNAGAQSMWSYYQGQSGSAREYADEVVMFSSSQTQFQTGVRQEIGSTMMNAFTKEVKSLLTGRSITWSAFVSNVIRNGQDAELGTSPTVALFPETLKNENVVGSGSGSKYQDEEYGDDELVDREGGQDGRSYQQTRSTARSDNYDSPRNDRNSSQSNEYANCPLYIRTSVALICGTNQNCIASALKSAGC